ncbi:MAG: hypothetical protein WCT17_00435 [Bacilli bacterium]
MSITDGKYVDKKGTDCDFQKYKKISGIIFEMKRPAENAITAVFKSFFDLQSIIIAGTRNQYTNEVANFDKEMFSTLTSSARKIQIRKTEKKVSKRF